MDRARRERVVRVLVASELTEAELVVSEGGRAGLRDHLRVCCSVVAGRASPMQIEPLRRFL